MHKLPNDRNLLNCLYRYAVIGKEDQQAAPKAEKGDVPTDAVKWYSLLPESLPDEQQEHKDAMDCTSQDPILAEEEVMTWFSTLCCNSQTPHRGQELSQAELQSAISAYASLPSCQ